MYLLLSSMLMKWHRHKNCSVTERWKQKLEVNDDIWLLKRKVEVPTIFESSGGVPIFVATCHRLIILRYFDVLRIVQHLINSHVQQLRFQSDSIWNQLGRSVCDSVDILSVKNLKDVWLKKVRDEILHSLNILLFFFQIIRMIKCNYARKCTVLQQSKKN